MRTLTCVFSATNSSWLANLNPLTFLNGFGFAELFATKIENLDTPVNEAGGGLVQEKSKC
jgi:hypothetical protein